ncbi:TRAP transporter small permease [Oceanobacillus saliphilus]|uniref:TRAP transporter small permease n=1 Tax=Oceanobacillus saliphilus TaxID=2925834 RepID=UPI00201D9FA9|nr:TRAP transporter small permease [Oceanobacillus saliphilus]
MNLLNRWLDKIDDYLTYISAGTIFLMMFWIFADAFMRYAFNNAIAGTMELTGEYLLVIIVYFAISYTQKHNGHVNVNFLYRKFSKSTKRVVGLISNVLTLTVLVILGIENFHEGLRYLTNNIQSIGPLKVPLAPALMIITLGIFILCLRLIIDSINIIRNKKEFE